MTGSVTAALIGATALILAAVITARFGNRRQLNEIHVLVNSRLSEALEQIKRLELQQKKAK